MLVAIGVPFAHSISSISRVFSSAGRVFVKANLLLTHFGNLKWTHPHGGERESVFLRSERATPLICSAMAAQSVPSEEPGIKVAPLLFALLTPGSSDGWKNAPIAFSKKTAPCFFAPESCVRTGKPMLFSRWCCGSGCASFRWCGSETILHTVRLPIDRQDFCMMQ